MRSTLLRSWRLITLQVFAVTIGVAIAFVAPASSSVRTTTSANCTRYNPPTTSNEYCGQTATNFMLYAYTSSWALRTDNFMSLSLDRSWILTYISTGGAQFDTTHGYGTYGSEGSSGGNTAKAACQVDSLGAGLVGQCTTDW